MKLSNNDLRVLILEHMDEKMMITRSFLREMIIREMMDSDATLSEQNWADTRVGHQHQGMTEEEIKNMVDEIPKQGGSLSLGRPPMEEMTRTRLRSLIVQEVNRVFETQTMSRGLNNQPTTFSEKKPDPAYVDIIVNRDSVSDTIAGLTKGITSEEQALDLFGPALKKKYPGVDPENYSVTCTGPSPDGSWRCQGDRRDPTASMDPYEDYYADGTAGAETT